MCKGCKERVVWDEQRKIYTTAKVCQCQKGSKCPCTKTKKEI